MNPAPATKVQPWLQELTAVPPPSQARLTAILDDITSSMRSIPYEQKAEAYNAKAITLSLLGDEKESLSAHRNACRLDVRSYVLVFNMAVTLQKFQRYGESLDKHADALGMDGGYNPRVLASLARTLANLGEMEEARKALNEALRLSMQDTVGDLRGLAAAAASLGLHTEAVELIARGLRCQRGRPRGDEPALTVLSEHADALADWLAWDTALQYSVAWVEQWQGRMPELSRLVASMPPGGKGDEAAWDEVFEATRGMRARANAAAEDSHG